MTTTVVGRIVKLSDGKPAIQSVGGSAAQANAAAALIVAARNWNRLRKAYPGSSPKVDAAFEIMLLAAAQIE